MARTMGIHSDEAKSSDEGMEPKIADLMATTWVEMRAEVTAETKAVQMVGVWVGQTAD